MTEARVHELAPLVVQCAAELSSFWPLRRKRAPGVASRRGRPGRLIRRVASCRASPPTCRCSIPSSTSSTGSPPLRATASRRSSSCSPTRATRASIATRLADHGLAQVLFNAPPGDWDAGERGIACLPGRDDEFRSGVERALEYAAALGCPRVHVMAGLVPPGASRESLRARYVERVRWAAEAAARAGVTILIEPINTRDIPGYFLNRQDDAHGVLDEAGVPALAVQMDLYHCQIVEGDVATRIRRYVATGHVGHVQIAGVPERHEPDTGELDYRYLFAVLDESGYDGWVGCEYRPRAGADAGRHDARPRLDARAAGARTRRRCATRARDDGAGHRAARAASAAPPRMRSPPAGFDVAIASLEDGGRRRTSTRCARSGAASRTTSTTSPSIARARRAGRARDGRARTDRLPRQQRGRHVAGARRPARAHAGELRPLPWPSTCAARSSSRSAWRAR